MYLTKLTLLIVSALAAFLVAPCRAAEASPPAQTILNPAAPKKLLYPRIVIYTVSWCPHCRELKEYLTSRNIPFINRDVELEPAAMEELVQKYKTYGVPVVIIGKDQEIMKGFTAEQFEATVAKVRANSAR